MIKLSNTSTILNTEKYLATKETLLCIREDNTDTNDCRNFVGCFDCSNIVFADLSDRGNIYKNDFTSVINYGRKGSSYSYHLEDSAGNIYDLSTGLYGTDYSGGTLKLGVYGSVVNWDNVADLIGFGSYNLITRYTNIFTTTTDISSVCYKLMPYSCVVADGMIRITTEKKGYIENGNDYSNFSIGSWTSQYRLFGKFELTDYTTRIDNIQLTNRELEQIQQENVPNYNLRIENLKSDKINSILNDEFMANKIYIDDYNQNNIDLFKNKQVSLVEIKEPIKSPINGTKILNVSFTEAKQNILKRNY